MDDLELFISSKVQVVARSYDDGCILWRRESQTLLNLSCTAAKVSAPNSPVFPSSGESAAHPRPFPSQSCFRCLITDKSQRPHSQWHQALERLEEKRRWRKTAGELSEVFSRWKAKHSQHIRRSQGVINDELSEDQASIDPEPICYSEVKASTKIQQSVVEICEVSEEADEVALIECNDGIPTIQVNDEELHRDCDEHVSALELTLENETSLRSSVSTNEPTTPHRPPSASSSRATSPETPTSNRSDRLLENTPDTPESVLGPPTRAKDTPEPESPTPNRLGSSNHSPALLNTPKEFEYPPLRDDIFSDQNGGHRRDYGLRPRSRRSSSSSRSFRDRSRNSRRITRSRTISPSPHPEARGMLSSPNKNNNGNENPTFGGRVVSIKYTEAVIKHEGEVHSPYGSLQESKNEIQGTPAEIDPTTGSSLKTIVTKTLAEAIISTETPKYTNALEVYNKVTNGCAWTRFEDNATRCFGNNSKGRRCELPLKERVEDSIREAIEELEAISYENSFDGYQKQIEALVNLSLCQRNLRRQARGWRGHRAKLGEIILQFEKLVAESLSPGSRMIVSGLKATNKTASLYAQTIITTKQATYSAAGVFAGFKPWQPPGFARMNASSCLREVAGTPLNDKMDQKSGYIYAYQTEGVFGFVKIGYTTIGIEQRLKRWHNQCKRDTTIAFGSISKIPHIFRVEKLVHTELKEYRHSQTNCECLQKHKEWFQVEYRIARAVVEKWLKWMRLGPYDSNGALKRKHLKKLEEICGSAHLLLGTNKDVEGQEETFEFSDKRQRVLGR